MHAEYLLCLQRIIICLKMLQENEIGKETACDSQHDAPRWEAICKKVRLTHQETKKGSSILEALLTAEADKSNNLANSLV